MAANKYKYKTSDCTCACLVWFALVQTFVCVTTCIFHEVRTISCSV